jgi:hypothetical protein
VVDDVVVRIARPLGETGLEVGEAGDTGPVFFSGSTEDAEDLEDFVDFRITRKQRLACGHLGEDATNGPHVDACAVLTSAEENFGCAVPEGDDLGAVLVLDSEVENVRREGYLVGVGAQRDTEGSCQTKIGELEVALLVNEQVLWLQVAVQNAVGVAIANTGAKLVHELLDHCLAETHVASAAVHAALGQGLSTASLRDGQRLHVLFQIQVEVFKDEVQLVAVGVDNVEQAHNVGIAHLLEERNLADGSRRHTFILGFQTDLLECDDAVVGGAEVAGFVNNTVCACNTMVSSETQCERPTSYGPRSERRRVGQDSPSPIFSIFW